MRRKNRNNTPAPSLRGPDLQIQRRDTMHREPSLRDNAFAAARARRDFIANLRPAPLATPEPAPRVSDRARAEFNAPRAVDSAPRPDARRVDYTPARDDLSLRDDVATCKERPRSTRGGDGSSRPFVPWCSRRK